MTELVVLVPVLDRPQNVAPLVESFLAGCPDSSFLVLIGDPTDQVEQEAVTREMRRDIQRIHVCSTWTPEERSWPVRINIGVTAFPDVDWYLCAADDVTFIPGWWDATAALRADPRIGVIGTNDSPTGQGNPRVAAGLHTCHPLIRATYIQKYGTIDEPGKAVHDGYSHWYVDDELVCTAKHRDAWAYCREAVIEHHHPYWDPTIPWDATYTRGEANAAADRELFEARAPLFGVIVG